MKEKILLISGLLMVLTGATQAFAHSPLCACIENADGTVLCEGGFSDGSTAAGVEVRVLNDQGKVLVKGKMDKTGEFAFRKPKGSFTFVFDAGPGHVVNIRSSDIFR